MKRCRLLNVSIINYNYIITIIALIIMERTVIIRSPALIGKVRGSNMMCCHFSKKSCFTDLFKAFYARGFTLV